MNMSDPLSSLPSETPEADWSAVQRELRGLRTLFHITLVALVVVSGSLSVVLLRQVIAMRRQARDLNTILVSYQKNEEPVLEDFRKRLEDFARRNPDFRPILAKYFPASANGWAGGASPGVAPVPAPAPVAPRK